MHDYWKKMHDVDRIVSGAQIGADIAGLKAAKQLGLKTGGYVLQNCKTLAGDKPEWIELYGLTEVTSSSYEECAYLNIKHSNGTVRFAQDFDSPEELCTLGSIELLGKPYFDIPVTKSGNLLIYKPRFLEWLINHDIHVLNVAGTAYPFMERQVTDFLLDSLGVCPDSRTCIMIFQWCLEWMERKSYAKH